MNDMDQSKDSGEQLGDAEPGLRAGVDRRTMLKAAVAAGTIAGTWVAPRIQTFGFAPAGAATVCEFENPGTDDLNLNESDNTYVSSTRVRCTDNMSASFGNSGGQPDRIVFEGPGNDPFLPGCDQVVVRTLPEDCPPAPGPGNNAVNDPDVTGFAVAIDNANKQTDPGCDCELRKVTIYSSNRASIIAEFDLMVNPGHAFPPCPAQNTGPGIRVDFAESDLGPVNPCTLQSDARLAVTIVCVTTEPC